MSRTCAWCVLHSGSSTVIRALVGGFAMMASACAAQQQISAGQFETEVAGKTVYTRSDDAVVAGEHHFRDRRVTLLFESGECLSGRWEPRGDQICYVYHEDPGRWHCWTYHDAGSGARMFRLASDDPDATRLDVTKTDTTPLHCEAEALGVSYPSSSNSEP